MDTERARALLEAERDEVRNLLADAKQAGQEDRETEDDGATGDYADAAQPLTQEGMDDAEFEDAAAQLLQIANDHRTTYMCAERVYFRCHRMIVSDWLVARGHDVLHIDAEGPARPHKLFSEARIVDGQVIYRGDNLF